jgi:hypothetical protein
MSPDAYLLELEDRENRTKEAILDWRDDEPIGSVPAPTCGQCKFFKSAEFVDLPIMGVRIYVASHCSLSALLKIHPVYRGDFDEVCGAYVEDIPF